MARKGGGTTSPEDWVEEGVVWLMAAIVTRSLNDCQRNQGRERFFDGQEMGEHGSEANKTRGGRKSRDAMVATHFRISRAMQPMLHLLSGKR